MIDDFGLLPLLNVSVNCSTGWTLNGTSCYYVYTDRTQKLSFWKANGWCKKQNGFLTSVLSERENSFLDRLISKTNLRLNETFYVGLRSNVRKLSWLDGERYNYTNWHNNSNEQELLSGNQQKCAYYDYLHQWQLNDKCGTNRLFICKQTKSSAGIVHNFVYMVTAKTDSKHKKFQSELGLTTVCTNSQPVTSLILTDSSHAKSQVDAVYFKISVF